MYQLFLSSGMPENKEGMLWQIFFLEKQSHQVVFPFLFLKVRVIFQLITIIFLLIMVTTVNREVMKCREEITFFLLQNHYGLLDMD